MISPFVTARVMGKLHLNTNIYTYTALRSKKNLSKKCDLGLKSDLQSLDEVGESAKELTLAQW